MNMYSYCMFMYLHRANRRSSATLTEVFPCHFLGCRAKFQGITRKDAARPALFQKLLCSSMYCLFYVVLCIVCVCVCVCVCKCILYYCHRVATQSQLINISHHIKRQMAWTFLLKETCACAIA